jgi:flagellar biosynthesis protein FlhF
MPAFPEYLKKAYALLVEHDVDEKIAATLAQEAYRKLGGDSLMNQQSVDDCVLEGIASGFRTAPVDTASDGQRRIVLVGPTGVGKTTTIAKLAAIYKLIYKQEVALISADTYRIGAIEQLRTFAAIADIPLEVVYKPSEKNAVFVDTVGRSQRGKKEINELARFVTAADPHEVHLVLSASASQRTMNEVVENFRTTLPNRIIFSKIDEAVTFGQMLNIAHASGLPISLFTTGQSVPDDISVAGNVQLAKMVYTGEVNV